MRARTRRLKSLSRVTAVTSSADRRPPPAVAARPKRRQQRPESVPPFASAGAPAGVEPSRSGAGRRRRLSLSPGTPGRQARSGRALPPLRYAAEVTSPMAIAAFSPEWAQAFQEQINTSPVYKQAGRGWKWTVGLVVEAEPDRSFPESRGIVLDLFEGEARSVRVGSAADAQACDFVISGSY